LTIKQGILPGITAQSTWDQDDRLIFQRAGYRARPAETAPGATAHSFISASSFSLGK
jgi:hypothetical protein